MFGAVRTAVAGLALAAGVARAEGWVVFPISGGAVAYYDSLFENKQAGTVSVTVGNYTPDYRRDSLSGDYYFAFESWHVNCKTVMMKPEKVVRYVSIALPPVIDREFLATQAWTSPGDDGWARLVVQLACTSAQAPSAQTAPNQPAAMDLMAKLGAKP